jgi:lipoprotein LpqH
MSVRFLVLAGAGLLVGAATACSSPAAAPPRAGTIPAGTADVTIDGRKLATSQAVGCTFIQSFITVTTGDGTTGTTTVVDNADGLAAKSVDIRDLGGFTGSYWQNLGGEATVAMTGRTFTITGSAEGFDSENASARIARPFSITASC